MSNFTLSLKTADDVVVMMPRGYVDGLGAERLEEASEEVLGRGTKKLVVNFSDIQFINSVGMSILTGVVQRTRESAGQLCFTNMKKVHREVIELVGLAQHVKVFNEEGDALHYLHGRQ